ncbi:MAG: hypothetical protein V3V10_08605, partial [Planctomycetota bacterium]
MPPQPLNEKQSASGKNRTASSKDGASLNSKCYSKIDLKRVETRQIERPPAPDTDVTREITDLTPSPHEESIDLTIDELPVTNEASPIETTNSTRMSDTEVRNKDGAQNGTSVNGLFALLSKLETIEGVVIVRIRPHPEGQPVGSICMENGVIVNTKRVGSDTSMVDLLSEKFPDCKAKLENTKIICR